MDENLIEKEDNKGERNIKSGVQKFWSSEVRG